MKITREYKIGLIALITIVLAIWGINYLKGKNMFKSTDKYYAVYGNVKGLVENAVVFLNGYKVGNVTRIEFDEKNLQKIVVEISLSKRVKLAENTTLLIKSGSIISGTKDVDLILGDGPGFHESGDTLRSAMQVDLTDYIEPLKNQIESVVSVIDTLVSSVSELLDNETRENLQLTISNLQAGTASLKRSLQPSGDLYRSFENLSGITENINKNNEDISKMLNNLAALSDSLQEANLKNLIAHADETFSKTAELFTMINSGQGSAGKLIVNDSLYNNLNKAITSLDSLLIDLREHPNRYVQVSVFGKKND